jgi:glutathione S-transferase
MLKLYGFSVSNYYNMVKLALLEKGLAFEEVPFFAGQTPAALAISPRGKVPVLGVKQGFINETSVILEYIEQTQEGPLAAAGRTVSARSGADIVQGNRAVHRAARPCVFRRSVFWHAGAGGDQGQSPGRVAAGGWGR